MPEVISPEYSIDIQLPAQTDTSARSPFLVELSALAANIAVPLQQFPEAQTVHLVDKIASHRSDPYTPQGPLQRLRTPEVDSPNLGIGLVSYFERLEDGAVIVNLRLPNLTNTGNQPVNALNEIQAEGREQRDELPAFAIESIKASRSFFGRKMIRPNARGLNPQIFLSDVNAAMRYLLQPGSDCIYSAGK